MTRPIRRLVALAAAASMVVAIAAPATAGVAAAAGNAAVLTEEPTDVTDAAATLRGNLTDPGGAANASVAFGYWKAGDPANASAVGAGEVNGTGPFQATVDGLSANTTYAYVATANATGVVTGENVTFTTDVEAWKNEDDPFGQRVSSYVQDLFSQPLNVSLGAQLSEWVTANNPGAENRPDHAGPDGDRGPPDHAKNDNGGDRGEGDDGNERGERGGQGDAGNASDDEEKERGPPDHAKNDERDDGDDEESVGDDENGDDDDEDGDDEVEDDDENTAAE